MNVKIEKLVYGGEGLGHSDGNTVFVRFVLPGEEVAIRPVERKKKFVRGMVSQMVSPSRERIAGDCRHFTVCGGCDYQHIPYATQLQFKAEILRETLARLGRVSWAGEIRTHASPAYGYRNRAQWKVRWSQQDASWAGIVGYNRAASSAVFAAEECPILAPALAGTLSALRGGVESGTLPSTLREVEAFTNPAGELMLNAAFTEFEGAGAKLMEAFRTLSPSAASILLHHAQKDAFHLEGPGFVSYPVGGLSYRVGHLSFFQTNRFLLEALVEAVTAKEKGAFALDLYAGVGLFALPLARQFDRVLAVESNEVAVRDLTANATGAGVRIHAVTQEVERYLTGFKETPDFVALDPPRAGIGGEAALQLRRIGAPRMTYLSCDPATLARDLAVLTDRNGKHATYEIRELELLDVFPQTFHIETIARLERA